MRAVEGLGGSWATVVGVHGAAGTSRWRLLHLGRPLAGPWEAIELAHLRPGGVSGLHRHTRTSEIYFSLAGQGELSLDGETFPMPAGHMALTTTSSTHGIRNAGTEDFYWLVIEAPSAAALTPDPTTKGDPLAMSRPHPSRQDPSSPRPSRPRPIDLSTVNHVDLTVFDAHPFLDAHYQDLEPGRAMRLRADGCELFAYLLSGEAAIADGASSYELTAGTGVTLTSGETVELRTASRSTLFWARSAVEE